MCDLIGQAINEAIERRRLLGGAGASILAAVLGKPASAAEVAQQEVRIAQAKSAAAAFNTRLLLLGTAGGPTYWPNTNRCGTSSALVVGDAVYLVDCGDGVGKRLQESLEPTDQRATMKTLRAVFLTHLHSDHVIDYPNILLYGWFAGIELGASSLRVFGPGRRGEMEPVFKPSGRQAAEPQVMNPSNPTPGTVDMTEYLYQAFATDINDRIRDSGKKDLRTLVKVEDIKLPEIAGFKSPNETPEPEMQPFKIYEDDRVRVSATLVYHAPIWPAFAYRFDTDAGAVVFSGDTAPCQNLVRLSTGADILVHEVIVSPWIDRVLPPPRNPAQDALRTHLLNAHTPVEKIGKVAESAGVSTLVLNHIVPGNAHAEELIPAQQDFAGQLVIGEDLLQLGVRRARH